jgi:hypothetical protein
MTVVGRLMPITPSPLRSWWKLGSSASNATLFPGTAASAEASPDQKHRGRYEAEDNDFQV